MLALVVKGLLMLGVLMMLRDDPVNRTILIQVLYS